MVGSGEHPFAWPVEPMPGRPHHRHEDAFQKSRRDIDDTVLNFAECEGLQMITDGLNVEIHVERGIRLNDFPGLFDKTEKLTTA